MTKKLNFLVDVKLKNHVQSLSKIEQSIPSLRVTGLAVANYDPIEVLLPHTTGVGFLLLAD